MREFIKTSAKLEEILDKVNLRVFEVIQLDDKNDLLRFDFSVKADEGGYVVIGETSLAVDKNITPRKFAEFLRNTADHIDNHWAKAFPTAIDNEITTQESIDKETIVKLSAILGERLISDGDIKDKLIDVIEVAVRKVLEEGIIDPNEIMTFYE